MGIKRRSRSVTVLLTLRKRGGHVCVAGDSLARFPDYIRVREVNVPPTTRTIVLTTADLVVPSRPLFLVSAVDSSHEVEIESQVPGQDNPSSRESSLGVPDPQYLSTAWAYRPCCSTSSTYSKYTLFRIGVATQRH